MAEWTTAYVNDLPDSAFACVDAEGRHYPHHDSSGSLDLPHLRAALSRVGDASNTQCGKAHLEAHAKAAGVGQKALIPLKATVLDDDAFKLLALPYGGPIPHPGAPRGADLDRQWFSERTEFHLDYFPIRLVDWHHGADPKLGRATVGKAVDPEEDEDGRWVTVWLKHGERRLNLIRRLAEEGGKVFGSSEAVPGMSRIASQKGVIPWRRDIPGEIVEWPYMRQTLSTSPQNTYSVIRPLKATLDDLAAEDSGPTAAFFDDLAHLLDNLGSDPAPTLSGDGEAKAGRVLAGRNEARLREALTDIDEAYFDTKRRRRAIAAIKEVLDELDKYLTPVAL